MVSGVEDMRDIMVGQSGREGLVIMMISAYTCVSGEWMV